MASFFVVHEESDQLLSPIVYPPETFSGLTAVSGSDYWQVVKYFCLKPMQAVFLLQSNISGYKKGWDQNLLITLITNQKKEDQSPLLNISLFLNPAEAFLGTATGSGS